MLLTATTRVAHLHKASKHSAESAPLKADRSWRAGSDALLLGCDDRMKRAARAGRLRQSLVTECVASALKLRQSRLLATRARDGRPCPGEANHLPRHASLSKRPQSTIEPRVLRLGDGLRGIAPGEKPSRLEALRRTAHC